MHTYLINLGRRPDRLANMDAALTALGLPYTRIEAADGSALTLPAGQTMPAAAYGCYLSHIEAYRAFLATDAQHCVIMEDDVALSPRLPEALKGPFFSDTAITRLEAPTNVHWKLPSYSKPKAVARAGGLATYQLISRAYGTGAFVLPRALARRIVEAQPMPEIPIDLRLFHPRLPGHLGFAVHQFRPALALQKQFLNGEDDSNIALTAQHPSQWNSGHPMVRNFKGNVNSLAQMAARLAGFNRSYPFADS